MIHAATSAGWSSSTTGAVALVLLGALTTFVLTYVPAKFKEARQRDIEARQRDDQQLVILTELKVAVSPEGRKGLVERMEIAERDLSNAVKELESHIELSGSQRVEILQTVEQMKRDIETVRGMVVDRRPRID